MALWVCKKDGVRYAVGAPACPQCGSTERYEDGAEAGAAAEVDYVPDGSATDVLDWVGGDLERAARALAAEQDAAKPRSTLVDQLTKLLGEGAK